MTPQNKRNIVPKFTPEQLEWLEIMFPENLVDSATPLELARSQGSRQVLYAIRQHLANIVRNIDTPKSL